ncbi:MAG: hypothetical protein KAU01_06385 [Candidatus Cloacimonetes bacterium]|nr:hypothetical protein [Candidatus Cloacimonadota bacterium]
MKKLLFIISIIFIVMLNGCSENSDGSNIPKNFTMNFLRNYIKGTGYAILQLDNSVAYQEINGDETIVFEDVNSSRGTVILIQDYYLFYNDQHRINIIVNIDVPLGEWYLKGYNHIDEPLGEIDITLNFPGNPEDYEGRLISYSNYYYYSSNATSNYQGNVYYLDNDENISFFTSVYNSNTGIAYCDWVISENFVQNEINYFNFELDKPMLAKTVFVNRLIDRITIYAYKNDMLDWNTISINNFWNYPVIEFTAFYRDDFPHDKYRVNVAYYGDTEYYSFNYFDYEITSDIDIPMSSISADFDNVSNQFKNIEVSGNADQILAQWSQQDSIKYMYLTVYGQANIEEIALPEIPTEILDQLDIDLSLFTMNSIGINDYDTANNSDDVINITFLQQAPFTSLHNQSYFYQKFDNNEALQREKENEYKYKYKSLNDIPTLEKLNG